MLRITLPTSSLFGSLMLALALCTAAAPAARADGSRDSLFVGDGVGDKVEVFDAVTGTFRRSLSPAGLLGPRGIVTRSGQLFLVDQNVNTDSTGEVLRFNVATAMPVKRLVPADTQRAPFAPRGMVLWHDHLFVANVCDPCEPPKKTGGGRIFRYTAAGTHRVALELPPGPVEFHPFGVVIGPDGLLYVSSRPNLFSTGLGGQVLQYDPKTGRFLKIFVSSSGGDHRLNGPEGLVFGPDGRLYVTSFRGSDRDTDKILIFDGPGGTHPGRRVDKIDLDAVGTPDKPEPRATAFALLFGPGGDLFVPINNVLLDDAVDTGAVRRYRIGCRQTATRKCFTNFVAPADKGGKLGQGWYLTFGRTRPGTLAYGGHGW